MDAIDNAAKAGKGELAEADLNSLLSGWGVERGEGGGHGPALRFALTRTREFGLVISAGLGGKALESALGCFRKDRASVHAAAELTDADDFLDRFRRTFAHRRLNGPGFDEALRRVFAGLLALAGGESGRQILSLEIDPAFWGEGLKAASARCQLAPPPAARLPRPIAKIDTLIHPTRIGLMGVSGSGMNFGRIILRNLMAGGFPKERLVVIRPNEAEIDGVVCVENLKALTEKLDLLIVAVPSGAVYDLVDEIIAAGTVNSVMLIPGGLGETAASVEPAAALAARINAAHANSDGGPIFLGANCLGVVSHPGGYDSWFIPQERLPKPKKRAKRDSVMLSQSGAFMITRISRNPWLDPAYMLALGNQTDLTHGDMLTYFAARPDIRSIGIYVEGFKDLDGLDFVRAVRRAVLDGKQVVVYKSGRSEAGAKGVFGHTASIAGDPALFEAVVRQAGAMVAEDVEVFDDLFYMAGVFQDKIVGGNRLGGVSGAGFEAVGMADSIDGETFSLTMGELSPATMAKVKEILVAKKLDSLVEVRNAIDINPGADDDTHLSISEAFLADPNIDAVVVGMDPASPAIMALETSKLRPGHDIDNPASSVFTMPPLVERNAKPIIAVVDGGPLYDAMSARLMDKGVCVFRSATRAVRALSRYVEARLAADALRRRK